MGKIDVLVVGAGPSGLMMAAELTRYGLSCRIIDKNPMPSDKSKALAIQPRTLEIFDYLGIVDQFLAEGLKLQAANPISNGHVIARLSFERLPSPYPFILSLEQSKTEEILSKYLTSLDSIIERNVELIALEKTGDGVEATVRNNTLGQEEKIEAAWVIGCDGAHSFVRKSLNLPFEGRVFSDVFSLADVHVHWNYRRNELFAFPSSQGLMAAFPIPGKNRYRLIFILERCRKLLAKGTKDAHGVVPTGMIPEPTLEETEALLQKLAGPGATITDPIWMANFFINSRMVSNFRKGRIFLVGDAAHIHSPVGGQGMNTGLQDAFNLAWKLALVHHREANEALLDTYNLERRSFGKKLLKGTEFASKMVSLSNPLAIALRNDMLSWLLKFPAIESRIINNISQLAIRYPKSFISKESRGFRAGPKAGTRAPNIALHSKNEQTDLFALWRRSTSHHLLLFSGPEASMESVAELAGIAKRLTGQYKVFPVLISTNQIRADVPTYTDPSNIAHTIYGARGPCAYIIRPDGYIGYRQWHIDESKLEGYFRGVVS